MITIAIDPGKTGAIAVDLGEEGVDCFKMPETMPDICAFIADLNGKSTHRVAYIEKTNFALKGPSGHFMASQAIKVARSFETLRTALYIYGFETYEVQPNKWIRGFIGDGYKGQDQQAKRKRAIKEKAQQIYPHLKVTLQKADALGLLAWATKGER